eukprot:COSAG02_NODE_672_length_18655_cov_7.874003_6_plen_2500_part_00
MARFSSARAWPRAPGSRVRDREPGRESLVLECGTESLAARASVVGAARAWPREPRSLVPREPGSLALRAQHSAALRCTARSATSSASSRGCGRSLGGGALCTVRVDPPGAAAAAGLLGCRMSAVRMRAVAQEQGSWQKVAMAEAVRLSKAGRWEAAHLKYSELLEKTAHLLSPAELVDVYASRGYCCEKDGDAEQALDDYSEGVRIGGPRHKPLWFRGRLLAELGRWSEAVDDLRAAAELDPSHAATAKLLANAKRQSEEPPPIPGAGASELRTAVFTGSGILGIALASNDPFDILWLKADQDDDGVLGPEEVAGVLEMMGRNSAPQNADAVMLELDADHSGEISMAEFEAWYRRQPDCSDEDTGVVIDYIAEETEATRGLTAGMRIVSIANKDMYSASLQEINREIKAAGRPLTIVFAPPGASIPQQERVVSEEDDPVDFLKARQENGGSGASPLRIGQLVDYDDVESGKIITVSIADTTSDAQGAGPVLYTIALPNGGGQLQTDRSRLMLPGNRPTGSTEHAAEPKPKPKPKPEPEAVDDLRAAAELDPSHAATAKLLANAKRQSEEPPPIPGAGASELRTAVFTGSGILGIALASNDPFDILWLKADQDDDGVLGPEEVAGVLEMMGRNSAPQNADAVMLELDADHSGEISMAEFEAWYRRQPDCSDEDTGVVIDYIAEETEATRGLTAGMRIVSIANKDMYSASLQEINREIKAAGRPLTIVFAPPGASIPQQERVVSEEDDPVDFLKARQENGGSGAKPEPEPEPEPEPSSTRRVKARSVSEYMQQVQAKRQSQEDAAARTIQAAARGREARRLPPLPDSSDEEDAETALQKEIRGATEATNHHRGTARKVDTMPTPHKLAGADVGLPRPSPANEQQSARYIQATWRYRKARSARRDAATKLQASWRGKHARLVQESLEEEMLADLLEEEDARMELSPGDEDEDEDQDHIEVVCPAGVDSGDFVNLAFNDGREIQVLIPEGIRPGMSFIADVSDGGRASPEEDEDTVPPFDIGSALVHAGELQSAGKWNDAHVKYTEILENTAHLLDPGDLAELYNRRGLCCEKDGEVEQALDDYSEGIQRGGVRHSLLFHRGRLLAELGRWSEAKSDLSSASDLQPSHEVTRTLLKEAQEQLDQMNRKERMAKAEARRHNTAAIMVQSSFRGHQARRQMERQRNPSLQQLMSELREGGDVAAGRLRTILKHALDVLEPLLLQSPRGDPRKAKRSAVVSAEELAYETIDGDWCDTLASCDVDTLEIVVGHLGSLCSLKAGENSPADGFSILSELLDAIEQCTSRIQVSFVARAPLGMVFNCVPTESGLVDKLSVSKVDPGSQADVSTPRIRAGWNVISIGEQQVVQLEPEMALKALKPRPVTIVFSNANAELHEQNQPKQKQKQAHLDVAKKQADRTARPLATRSTTTSRRPPSKDGSPPQRTSRTVRKADMMPTPHKQSSHVSRNVPPLPESTAIPSAGKLPLPATSARSPARASASRPAKTPIARKPKLKLSSEARAKILASDEFKPLKQKLKALSYGTRGQDPRKLFGHYDRDNDGGLEFSEFKNAVRKGGHVTPAACSDAQLRKLFAAVDKDGSGCVEITELADFIWGNQNLLGKHGDHDAADHAAPPPEEIAEVAHGSLSMPTDDDRERAFDRMDMNRNGTLSLAEIDKAVVEVWPEFNHKKALMRAYKAADLSQDGTITRDEFPLLLKYIVYFDNLWEKFDSIDKDGDHQLNMEEFHQGAEMLGLGKEHGLNWATTVREFGLMDEDGGGAVRFDEFCAWCARKFISAQSSVKTELPKPARPQYDMMYYVTLGVDGAEKASEEVPVSHVQSLISTGHVTADTSVWAEGMDHGWLPLRDCASDFGLAEALGQRAPPPPPPAHEIEPVEGGARAALMDMIPLFHQTKQYLNKVDSNDRSPPNLNVVDQVTTQPTVLRSRPRGESWAVPSSKAASPLSPICANSKVDEPTSSLSSTFSASSTSSDEDGLLLQRPRGKSWGANRQAQLQQNQNQEPELEQEQHTSMIRRPRGKSWGAPRQEQGQKQESEQEQKQQGSIIRRPRGTSWGTPRQEQEQQAVSGIRLQTISSAAEANSSGDSDDAAADGQSTPDFASVVDDEPSAMSAELDQRWRAMGGSDRVLEQIRQNLRGASYRKGGQDPRKLFEMYDRDNSGDIDRWEFRQAVRKGGRITVAMLCDVDLDRLFDCVDVDGDGDLSIDELIVMIWGDDNTKTKKPQPEALPEFRSQAKRMTDDARFESLREYYLDKRITAQRATPSTKTIRSALEKNDFAVLCGKLQAKYGVHPLAIFNERCVAILSWLFLICTSFRSCPSSGLLSGLGVTLLATVSLLLQACCFETNTRRSQRTGPTIRSGWFRWECSQSIAVIKKGQVTVTRGRCPCMYSVEILSGADKVCICHLYAHSVRGAVLHRAGLEWGRSAPEPLPNVRLTIARLDSCRKRSLQQSSRAHSRSLPVVLWRKVDGCHWAALSYHAAQATRGWTLNMT